MTPVEVLVFLGIATVAIGVWLVLAFQRIRDLNAAVTRLAPRLGAQVVHGRLFSEPSVEFSLAGRQAWLEFHSGSRSSSPYTRVVVNVRADSPGSLHIVPEGFGLAFLTVFGAQDLEIGDADFDSRYVVRAVPETLAHHVFRPEQRHQAVASVLRLKDLEDPTIDLDRHHLTIQTREYETNEHRLMEMVKTAEEFLTYVYRKVGPTGVQFAEVTVSTSGRCPVCGTGLGGPVVRCEFCRTPHHSECWKYMGRCSTYACKGRRSVA